METRIEIISDYYCDQREDDDELTVVINVKYDEDTEKHISTDIASAVCGYCGRSVELSASERLKLSDAALALSNVMVFNTSSGCPDRDDDDDPDDDEPMVTFTQTQMQDDFYIDVPSPPPTPQSPDPFNF